MSVSVVQNGVRKVVADTSTMALSNLATIEGTTTASKAYAVGDYLVLTGQLYKVTQAIAQGGTITVGTNVVADTVGSELSTLNTHLKDIEHGSSAINNINVGQTIYVDITFNNPFTNVPTVLLTERGSVGEQTFAVTTVSKTGFQFYVNNGATIPVSYTINWLAVD